MAIPKKYYVIHDREVIWGIGHHKNSCIQDAMKNMYKNEKSTERGVSEYHVITRLTDGRLFLHEASIPLFKKVEEKGGCIPFVEVNGFLMTPEEYQHVKET